MRILRHSGSARAKSIVMEALNKAKEGFRNPEAGLKPNGPAPSSGIWTHLALALLGICAGTALVLIYLHRNGFWIDELYTLHAIRLSAYEMVVERLRRGHFPLYFGLLKGIVFLAGGQANETTMRAPSIAFWLLGIGSFWLLAQRLLEPKSALAAISLFALNGLAIRQATEARMYTLVLLEAVWVTRAYFEMLHAPDRTRWRVVYYSGTLLAWWTSPSFALISGAVLADAWRRRRAHPRLLFATLGAPLLAAATLVPGAVVHVQIRQQKEIAHTNIAQVFLHAAMLIGGAPVADSYYHPNAFMRACQVAGGFVTAVVLWRIWRTRTSMCETARTALTVVSVPLAIMVITWILAEVTGLSVSAMGPARYVIGAVPCGALLTGQTLGDWISRQPKRMMSAHIAMTLLLLLGAFGVVTVRTEPFRNLVRNQLRPDFKPGDGVIAVPEEIADGIEMYLPIARVDVAMNRWQTDEAAISSALRPLASRSQVWFVWYRGRESKAIEVAEKLFGPPDPSGYTTKIGMLRLFRFHTRSR